MDEFEEEGIFDSDEAIDIALLEEEKEGFKQNDGGLGIFLFSFVFVGFSAWFVLW